MTKSDYEKNSITLPGAVAMGTGVMIGAGIFALTGQIAELAGPLFPLSFVVGAIVTAFSAYTYIKMSNAFPSAGGIGMILKKAYGPTTVAAGAALLMALSMVINESLVARTFGTYTLRAFGADPDSFLVPVFCQIVRDAVICLGAKVGTARSRENRNELWSYSLVRAEIDSILCFVRLDILDHTRSRARRPTFREISNACNRAIFTNNTCNPAAFTLRRSVVFAGLSRKSVGGVRRKSKGHGQTSSSYEFHLRAPLCAR